MKSLYLNGEVYIATEDVADYIAQQTGYKKSHVLRGFSRSKRVTLDCTEFVRLDGVKMAIFRANSHPSLKPLQMLVRNGCNGITYSQYLIKIHEFHNS